MHADYVLSLLAAVMEVTARMPGTSGHTVA